MAKKQIKIVPQQEQQDVVKYDGWLLSDNFFKRCLAVWGHAVMGYLFLVLIFFAISIIVMFFLGFLGFAFGA